MAKMRTRIRKSNLRRRQFKATSRKVTARKCVYFRVVLLNDKS